MHYAKRELIARTMIILLMCTVVLSCQGQPKTTEPEFLLVGSTPGDPEIKRLFTIASEDSVDFIRWHLTLSDVQKDPGQFHLDITYGLSKPNTLGFVEGGKQKSIKGEYSIQYDQKQKAQVYRLKSKQIRGPFALVKISSNVFHLLSQSDKFMKGNGGWSYTLNRKASANVPVNDLPQLSSGFDPQTDTTTQFIFEGRTPCQELAKEKHITVVPECFKMKWKLILHRDPKDGMPTNYIIRRTNNRANDLTGTWTIRKGIGNDPNALVFQLDPDKPEKSISFLVGDDQVIFFLRNNGQLFVGNSDFSYTLNRRSN